jgi:hypothetical protein
MVRERAALLGLYNVSGETTLAAFCASQLTRSLGSPPAELMFAAGRCHREEKSQQRATLGRHKQLSGNTQITNELVSDL